MKRHHSDIYRRRQKHRRQQMREPYDPLGTFENQRQYNKEVKLRARSMFDPLLDEIRQAEDRETSASRGRSRAIGGWQNQYQGTLNKAFGDTRSALNELISLGSASDANTQASLRAALDKAGQENASLGATIGGPVPQQSAQPLGAILAAPSSMNQLLQRSAAAGLTGAGERQGLAGLAGLRSMEEEGARHRAEMTGFEGQRKDVMARVPDFLAQARQQIGEEQMNRQNLRFQQGLANKEFGLKKSEFKLNKQNLKFQQWLAAAGFDLEKFKAHDQSAQGWAGLAIQRDTLKLQRDQLNADIASGANGVSEADSKRWNNAVQAMTGFTEPTDADRYPSKGDWADAHPRKAGQVNPTLYRRNHRPQDLFRTLVGQVMMSPAAALRLMLSSSNRHTRSWAHTEFQRRKFRRGAHQGSATPRNLDGTPG